MGRCIVASPLIEDLGDLSLHGLDGSIAQLSDEREITSELVVALKLQRMAFGVPS